MSRKIIITLAVLALILLAWMPWISLASAERSATHAFEQAWENVADGCGFNCQGCGLLTSQRVPFGIIVSMEYACGMLPADSPEYHRFANILISPFGTIHGVPQP